MLPPAVQPEVLFRMTAGEILDGASESAGYRRNRVAPVAIVVWVYHIFDFDGKFHRRPDPRHAKNDHQSLMLNGKECNCFVSGGQAVEKVHEQPLRARVLVAERRNRP